MRLTQTVERELILLTAKRFQFQTYLIVQVEWVAHDRKGNIVFVEQIEQPPEIRVQDRIASCQIEVRQSAVHLAEVETVIERVLHLLPAHTVELAAGIA